MKKAISGLLALILVLSLCAGCGDANKTPDQTGEPGQTGDTGNIYTELLGVDPSETALETEGNTIPMELYLYWVTYACSNLEYQINMLSSAYGMYGELLNEDGSLKWDADLEGTTVAETARQQAEANALSYAILENVAAEHGVTLTDEDKANLEEEFKAYLEQVGGEEAYEQSLKEMGISRESFDRVSASTYLYQHLVELAQDPSSDLYQAPTDDDAYVDHILLMTKDSETNEPLSEEEIAAKKAKAEELLAQLQASDDLETLFTQLADENGEDPGRESEKGYLINPDTNFVQEFKDAAFALKPGEISGIVETDYGYHILLRKELTEDQLLTVASTNLSNYLDEKLTAVTESVTRSEKLAGINVGEFFAAYREAVEAMHPAEDTTTDGSNAGADSGGAASDGSTGGSAE